MNGGEHTVGWSVSRHSEAHRKRNTLDRRLGRLRAAVKAGEGPLHVANASERVRRAALAFIKAKRALITEYPDRDPDGRQSQNLDREEGYWLSVSPETIADEHG